MRTITLRSAFFTFATTAPWNWRRDNEHNLLYVLATRVTRLLAIISLVLAIMEQDVEALLQKPINRGPELRPENPCRCC
ncbi:MULTISPECIES: hypothetical protein [Pseudomonas]|uniref:hypothetical protein n=1 Tax=Pseudomonas TaxID=286 RepID=UPI0004D40634|nr:MULTISPECIES: hypothetical protein [Pseudomonas]KES20058.1 hypothetical protein FG99_00875 [Pseudomonas sp. AAC]MDU4251218.1 hypothetical protein [Pseudomonas sp.]NMZ75042.1 hypothetical protein [Pseudomonas nitroreducens]OBY59542.1 hypothetical protein A9513_027950 [Pseudomonas sp. AU12215]OHS15576.1 hypothetical protein HMPREF3289_05755 [Pseudomonas sp. HMSC75E02]